MSDWRQALLAGAEPLPLSPARRDPVRWPGYQPRASVSLWLLPRAVFATWDFAVLGGSFGEDDATALVEAVAQARARRLPLVTVVASGGTRLQEGTAALVGIPRARLALRALAADGLAHLSVADAPTTGGVWISVTSAADLRVAVEGATVGFAGPRVVQAVTGTLPPEGSHTATSAARAGLVDAALPGEQVPAWVDAALTALTSAPQPVPTAGAERPWTARGGWEQVQRSRRPRPGGRQLLERLLPDAVPLRAPRGDTSVAAVVGRAAGRPCVGVAVAAEQGGRPTPDGYRLVTRAVRLAGRLGLPVLTLVDTPGAEPGQASEEDGIAPAMGEALDALLECPTPTLALVHGEGGSGGALAVAAADRLLVTEDAWFAAIAPEGASAALRRPPQECADLLRPTPADLRALGVADAVVGPEDVLGHLVALLVEPAGDRLLRRSLRWSGPVPGRL